MGDYYEGFFLLWMGGRQRAKKLDSTSWGSGFFGQERGSEKRKQRSFL